jgi:putative ABC transport system substrate-binding protein
MRRRDFIKVIGGAAATWPVAARAQQVERIRRIGVMMGYAGTDPAAQAQVAALRQGLQKLGWEEGRNIRIDLRFPGGDAGVARAIIMELMSLTPDVLVTNTNLVTAVVQAEVRTVPIVFISVGDPIGSGFVGNEARPNGNLTGFANWEPPMGGKWLALLQEVAPQIERIGFLLYPTPANLVFFKFAEALTPAPKVKPVALEAQNANEIEQVLAAFAAKGNGGIVVISGGCNRQHRPRGWQPAVVRSAPRP